MGVVHQLAAIGGVALTRAIGVENLQLHFVCLLKAHMNLNGIQRLYGLMGWKCLDNKFQVLTNI